MPAWQFPVPATETGAANAIVDIGQHQGVADLRSYAELQLASIDPSKRLLPYCSEPGQNNTMSVNTVG